MKTSSKIILENIKINKELRINVASINDRTINDSFNRINYLIDDINNSKMNEQEKIYYLEQLIKELIDFSNTSFLLLYSKDQERLREKERVKRYKSFLDIKKEVEDEIPEPGDDEEPKLTPQQQKIINKLKL